MIEYITYSVGILRQYIATRASPYDVDCGPDAVTQASPLIATSVQPPNAASFFPISNCSSCESLFFPLFSPPVHQIRAEPPSCKKSQTLSPHVHILSEIALLCPQRSWHFVLTLPRAKPQERHEPNGPETCLPTSLTESGKMRTSRRHPFVPTSWKQRMSLHSRSQQHRRTRCSCCRKRSD